MITAIYNQSFSTFGVFLSHSFSLSWLLLFSHSVVSDSWWHMDCSMAGFLFYTISQSLPKLTSIESVMPSNHFSHCLPIFLLPSIFPNIRGFSNELTLYISWPYWSFSFSISPSNDYFRLMSFRIDWLDLLAVQGTLTGLLQHHSSKASVLRPSAFFMVQL